MLNTLIEGHCVPGTVLAADVIVVNPVDKAPAVTECRLSKRDRQ